ncbi:sugar transferase [bacterium]|nr:sugar transferase [bacterium]
MYKNGMKRIFDLILAFTAFVIAFPVFCVTIFLLLFANRGKVFFIQTRPGKKGIPFNIIKFKTMNDKKDSNGALLEDHLRLTRVGNIVRRLSLDEVPQLLNVIKGDMSLIGPRPLLMEYLPLYNEVQSRRHEVCPGITGWAQVNGRNAISWGKKFEYDVWYIDNLSFALDCKIVLKTLNNVLNTSDVSSSTSVTMEKFKGL